MILLLIFVISGVICNENRTYNSDCSYPREVSCDNGECIFRLKWCDSEEDCSDGSDERKGCIPFGDVQADSTLHEIRAPNGRLLPEVGRETIEAISKAVKYIVSQVTDNGWEKFTPRAVVALSFANMVSPITPDVQALMMHHLKVHLMRDLLEMTVRRIKPSLTSLASFINALYATCQDPRSFQGHDLVALLRSEVDAVMSSNFSYPYVLMSLCLADSIKGDDVDRLADMFNKDKKPAFQALAVTAMNCIGNKDEHIHKRIQKYMKRFFNDTNEAADKMDVYSKALYLQAAIASNFTTATDIARYHLESHQLPNGSFGSMLATYSSIPVFLYSSLLDLRCELPERKALTTSKESRNRPEHEVVYSLSIVSGQGIDTHSMTVPFGKGATLLDVMKNAASRNPLYKFLYEETPAGKKVFSLAGIPNDIETARKWTLHEGRTNFTIDSLKHLKEITVGVDKIIPKDKKHFSFWLSR